MYKKESVSLPNGETYAYLEQGEGDTILLLHGNLSSSVHYLPLFRHIKGVRLVAPDLRGFGDSTYNMAFSNLADLALDVKLFAEALGISRTHVVGWSTGGGIAFELAIRYPDLVSSLFLIQAVSHKGHPFYKKNLDGTFVSFANKEEMAQDPFSIGPTLASYTTQNALFLENLWNKSIYTGKKPGEEENRLYISETLKQRNLLDVDWALVTLNLSDSHNGYATGAGTIRKISCPVTLTCADKDLVVPQVTSRENAAAIKGSKLIEYENCGHSPLVDCPERLASDILAHINMV